MPAGANIGFASASANAFAESKRSAGNFSSAQCTAAATFTGTFRRMTVSGCGSYVISRAMIACAVVPVNGGSPASISYVTAPSA